MLPDFPAFPQTAFLLNDGSTDFPCNGYGVGGLTMRDHIAIQVACAAITNPGTTCPWSDDFLQRVSYEFADRMIEESNKPPKP